MSVATYYSRFQNCGVTHVEVSRKLPTKQSDNHWLTKTPLGFPWFSTPCWRHTSAVITQQGVTAILTSRTLLLFVMCPDLLSKSGCSNSSWSRSNSLVESHRRWPFSDRIGSKKKRNKKSAGNLYCYSDLEVFPI